MPKPDYKELARKKERYRMRVAEVIDAIKRYYKGYGAIEDATSRDQILYGTQRLAATCTGLVTTVWATSEVIERAHALGANLIICHEGLFWNHGDHLDWMEEQELPVFQEKKALLDRYGMTVWRCHDYIHSGIPMPDGSYRDGIFQGLAHKLGWEDYIIGDDFSPQLFAIPEQTGRQLAHYLLETLDLSGARIIGDSDRLVKKVKIPFHIFGDANADIIQMETEAFDVLLPLEMVDFSLAGYIKDASLLGYPKLSISLGHFNLEEPGMEYMLTYLPAILGEDVPLHFVKAGDSYSYVTRSSTT